MQRRNRGFTIIELLVVIAIIGLLAGMLMVALARVRHTARETTCRNNMRNLGQCLLQYQSAYNGSFPAYFTNPAEVPTNNVYVGSWLEKLELAGKQSRVEFDIQLFNCPERPGIGAAYSSNGSASFTGELPYAYNVMIGGAGVDKTKGAGARLASITMPSATVLLAESDHNLGAAKYTGAGVNLLSWKITVAATVKPQVDGLVAVYNTPANQDRFFPHGTRDMTMICFADGSVMTKSLDEVVADGALLAAGLINYGAMWDNVKP